MNAVASVYEAFPMTVTQERSEILSKVMRGICGVESVFSDYQRVCEEKCYVGKPVDEMCELCAGRMTMVANSLLRPDALVWEVWKDGTLSGVIRFSGVRRGEDATAHYVFLDSDLRGKTGVMRSVIEWAFADHPESNWIALRRLTIEVPDFAYALARHASRKLGFGGPFTWKLPEGGPNVQVEGVRQAAVPWRGERRDLLILGLMNSAL